MANSAPKHAPPELIEPTPLLHKKGQLLSSKILSSKHFIVFTGAGISTSAGIPDFRGPEGVWTLRKQGRQHEAKSKSVETMKAMPTKTHMALVELQNQGILKYLVSQNCDGLHRKSGILPEMISELHGNSNREYCRTCSKEYLRDFRAVAPYTKTVKDHRTGRKCTEPNCNGVLLDSIINFGEYLWEDVLESARSHAKKADLCLVLGSSLTVPPANEIPETVGRKKKGDLVICNLQETPIDFLCGEDMRIWGKTDELMEMVMKELGLEIPEFILKRRLVVKVEGDIEKERLSVRIGGVDVDGRTPATFLQSVKLEGNRRPAKVDPFVIGFRMDNLGEEINKLKLELEFMGHFNEPNLVVEHEVDWESEDTLGREVMYFLDYNPLTGEWKTERGQ
ncbi:putative mono-ADP-ribosyltransferase sirtuin [Podospora fimiseda]|uniref:protein acetyllysine N-acetyltransferase n=1 Tax=Podospora fimiseda TaxID=252190 RepID=A0AAN7BF36_9PEZI|nr:putative mono-ADP-ribosyltransferase sirtuin [Podospora fimiseda]